MKWNRNLVNDDYLDEVSQYHKSIGEMSLSNTMDGDDID